MYTILEQPAEIAQAQKLFERSFENAGQGTKIKTGHKGKSLALDGFWIPDHGIWAGFRTLVTRYWNAFGIDLKDKQNSISCEIKQLFEEHYKGEWLNVDGDEFAVVGNLNRGDFVKKVAEFVVQVHAMKPSK